MRGYYSVRDVTISYKVDQASQQFRHRPVGQVPHSTHERDVAGDVRGEMWLLCKGHNPL